MITVNPSIFKAYDIRGIYPQDIDEDLAYKIGQAYVSAVKPQGEVLVGCDVRIYSPVLKENLIKGIIDSGVNVVDVGLMSTDMLYFGVGNYKTAGGIQVTASHNPPEWHGFKMVKEGPVPMTLESGIGQIGEAIAKNDFIKPDTKGVLRKMEIVDDYCDYILSWIDPKKIKPMKVVVNPNFGFAGEIFNRLVKRSNLPLTIVPLNEKPDGNFPKGRPDPFVPENRVEFSNLVKETGADLGITWDADADRVFFCADGGVFVEPYYLNTILIKQMLLKNPGEKIIYDPRYTWALIDAINDAGGKPVLVRVGHSYIKEAMIKENALFATESSGHTYYRNYWHSDCGMLPPVQVLEYLSETDEKLSEVVKPVMEKYFISGEINSDVTDKEEKMNQLAEKYKDAELSRLDGISIEYSDWRFTVRPSNTEPLLRLTLEAKSKVLMEQKRDEVLALIRT